MINMHQEYRRSVVEIQIKINNDLDFINDFVALLDAFEAPEFSMISKHIELESSFSREEYKVSLKAFRNIFGNPVSVGVSLSREEIENPLSIPPETRHQVAKVYGLVFMKQMQGVE